MKIVIHNYRTRDAFEESQHPRANNGQFGAGAGKSHAEHAAHHEAKELEHKVKSDNAFGSYASARRKGNSDEALGHSDESRLQANASQTHRHAAMYHHEAHQAKSTAHAAESSLTAHGYSKLAHEASQAAEATA